MSEYELARDEISRLVDMVQAARRASKAIHGMTWDAFQSNEDVQDIVIRRLSIVGEAARVLSQPAKDLFPTVAWRSIRDMRNILIHDYKGIEIPIVWDVARNHAPETADAILFGLKVRGIVPPPEDG